MTCSRKGTFAMLRASTFAKRLLLSLATGLFILISTGNSMAEGPSLPKGLGPGLSESRTGDAPVLPPGLMTKEKSPLSQADRTGWDDHLPVDFSGFVDARLGFRTKDDPNQADSILREMRLQLEFVKDWETVSFRTVADILGNGVTEEDRTDLENGNGSIDLREANLLYRASRWMDVKAGRQVLTWGTGDLIFINDLFPKDWNSFFIGRDLEYLKAPSDSIKVSVYASSVNVDVAYTPRFDPDRYIDGRRISYYHPALGEIVGRNETLRADNPDDWFDDDEVAARLYWNFGSYETALYGYDGYWKSPNGFDGITGIFTFPRLTVFGASTRGPVSGGIGNAEVGYYDSRDDGSGSDPEVRNSEWRVLLGYERELIANLTGSVQYYLEQMDDYGNYLGALSPGSPAKDHKRHVVTMRLTQLAMNQNLRLSLFNFYSPSDEDGYLRASSLYKMTDSVSFELGGNSFYGREGHTFFGQFENASNIYAGFRTSF
jgi:hypothetical protein